MRGDAQALQLMAALLHGFIAALVARVFVRHRLPDTEHRPPTPPLTVEPVRRAVRRTDAAVGVAARIDEPLRAGHRCPGREEAIADFDQAIVVARLAVAIEARGAARLRIAGAVDAMIGLIPQ